MVALTSHASWDGLVIGLRGLGAICEIAELFGLRPGPAVCWVLLRHISRAALETMGVDLLAQKITDQFLSATPHMGFIAWPLSRSRNAVRSPSDLPCSYDLIFPRATFFVMDH